MKQFTLYLTENTHVFSIIKVYLLMPFREIISVHRDNFTHHVGYILQGKMQRFLTLEYVLSVFVTVFRRI